MSSIHWTRIVELARQLSEEHSARGVIDTDVALRLARAVLLFQEQMVGTLLRTLRR
ncbi:MAG: hypothetical protein FWD17_13640 [Polyangiaceae bacterium]|nr:hypothetical protein [Polyangiaceae bacterium]